MNYRESIERLGRVYEQGEARAIVRLVAEKVFGLSWTDVLCGALETLPPDETARFDALLCRLERNEPVQYVIGRADFYGREFVVAPGVLIPRPETELLISALDNENGGKKVVDIGTGSGCIAISIALEHPDWHIEGWDVSDVALHIAKENSQLLKAENVDFHKVDILNAPLPVDGSFDIIVSNPPYILERERAEMERHVLDYEPEIALFVPDTDPLRFYRCISSYASTALKQHGMLLFEINREYGMEVAEEMKKHGFIDVDIQKDQFDNDRVVIGRKA